MTLPGHRRDHDVRLGCDSWFTPAAKQRTAAQLGSGRRVRPAGVPGADQHPVPGDRQPPGQPAALIAGPAENGDNEIGDIREAGIRAGPAVSAVIGPILSDSVSSQPAGSGQRPGWPTRPPGVRPTLGRPVRHHKGMNADQVAALRALLAPSGWLDRTSSFARAIRRSARTPSGLLIIGTERYEPWHLTAHLDDEKPAGRSPRAGSHAGPLAPEARCARSSISRAGPVARGDPRGDPAGRQLGSSRRLGCWSASTTCGGLVPRSSPSTPMTLSSTSWLMSRCQSGPASRRSRSTRLSIWSAPRRRRTVTWSASGTRRRSRVARPVSAEWQGPGATRARCAHGLPGCLTRSAAQPTTSAHRLPHRRLRHWRLRHRRLPHRQRLPGRARAGLSGLRAGLGRELLVVPVFVVAVQAH